MFIERGGRISIITSLGTLTAEALSIPLNRDLNFVKITRINGRYRSSEITCAEHTQSEQAGY